MAEATQLRAGDEVNAWCTKCRLMHTHIIKAIDPNGKKPPRVICTCPKQTERNYRPNPPKSRTKKKAVVVENPWVKLTETVNQDRVLPYTVSGSFSDGDFLQHKKYGLGVVIEILDNNKLSVAFEDKVRVMVCNK